MRAKRPTEKKPPMTVFYKNTYTIPRTKVDNWFSAITAEKKDNDVFRDGLSYHLSTYKRLGTDDQPFITETQYMTSQIYAKRPPQVLHLPLVNFTSYTCTENKGREQLQKESDLPQLPANYGITDYTSTQQSHFRSFSQPLKPFTMSSPPWMMNRVIRSEVTQNYGTAPPPGTYKCLDTHTPIHHIRTLRLPRYKSFDPATGMQSFPEVEQQLASIEQSTS